MRLTAAVLLLACLTASASGKTQTVSLNVTNAPLKTVLKEIIKQTRVTILYNEDILKDTKPVTLTANNVPLQQVLEVLFADQPIVYKFSDRYIVLSPKQTSAFLSGENAPNNEQPPPPVDISGRVTNAQGEPISGANVVIMRTQRGTITDADGKFTLKNLDNKDVIKVSFVGYTPLIVAINNRTDFALVMNVAVNKLDEAVVQAYGKTTQRLATGNISRVTAEEIEKQPVMNPLIALQAKVPGLNLIQNNGYASGTLKIEIRGRNSINPQLTSEPMYIVDGVPLTILDVSQSSSYQGGSLGFVAGRIFSSAGGQSPFFSLNPLDIESIEVLKDADATAIYGSRGANGVIMITTKKGKIGKPTFDLNVESGISEVPKFYRLLSTEQYVSMRKEALQNDGIPLDINSAPDLVVWDTTKYTNWQRYIMGGLGKRLEIQTSLSGGTINTTYRISGSFTQQKDVLTLSGSNTRASLGLNISQTSANKKFRLSLLMNNSYVFVDEISISPSAITALPHSPDVYDENGNLNYSGWTPLQWNFPFAPLLQPYTAKTNFLNSSLDLSYQLVKGLYLKTSFGYNRGVNKQTRYIYIASQDPKSNPVGTSQFGYSLIDNLIIEPQIEYNTFISKGKLTSLIGASHQVNNTEAVDNVGYGYTNDALMGTISFAPQKFADSYYGEYKYAAIFGRLNYNWKNKYIINLNARRDGSSRFGPGRQFGNFGSIGIAYIFSESKILKERFRWISFGKLRVSYGATGSDNISDYQFLSRWTFSPLTYNNNPQLNPQGHSDSLIQWQVNKKAEVGLSLGILERINIDAVFYRDRCNNQLIDFPLPAFTGFNSVVSNLPANVENRGWEFTINSKVFSQGKFKCEITANLSINRNKLIAYPNLDQSPFKDAFVIGKSLNIRKLLHVTGVDTQTGLYTFEDKNKDGNVSIDFSGKTLDDRLLYNLDPKFYGGFTTDFSYGNWNLSILLYFKKINRPNAYSSLDIPGFFSNQVVDILDRWQKPGDIKKFAKFTTQPYSDPSFNYFKNYSDGTYSDGTYLRLQNLSVSYVFPKTLISRFHINNLKLYLRGQNLFTITKYKGIDPEVPGLLTLPTLRVIVGGVSINL